MKCPLKFARYEFEGGETCIGAECGFYGCVCTDATNGMCGETNGIADGSPLVDRDPVEIMRECGGMEHGMGSLRKALGIECVSGWQMRCLKSLADMVERDYARRDAVNAEVAKLIAERDELTNAVNELQKKQPYCYVPEKPLDTLNTIGRYIDELQAERDEWKRKAEHDDAHSKAHSKTEPNLSEQSESLSDESDSRENGWYLRYDGYMTSKSNYLRISGFKAARALDNHQNLVFVKFMGGKEADCRVYAPKLDVCEKLHDSSGETQKPRSKEANPENMSDSDGENLHVEHDSREKLEADIAETIDFWGAAYPDARVRAAIGWLDRQAAITANELTSQSDALKSDETSENATSKCDMGDFDDSREKLEEDVRKHYSHTVMTLMYPPSANKSTDMLMTLPVDTVIGWLDRQEAITKAEQREWWGGVVAEQQAKVDELTAELEERKKAMVVLGKKYRDKTVSRDHWAKVAGRHANTIEKLRRQLNAERELATMWPRYEDGMPVRIGDMVRVAGGDFEVATIGFDGERYRLAGKRGTVIQEATFGVAVRHVPPKAADGKPIEVGQMVYGGDGRAWVVEDLNFIDRKYPVVATCDGEEKALKPEWLTHDRDGGLA